MASCSSVAGVVSWRALAVIGIWRGFAVAMLKGGARDFQRISGFQIAGFQQLVSALRGGGGLPDAGRLKPPPSSSDCGERR